MRAGSRPHRDVDARAQEPEIRRREHHGHTRFVGELDEAVGEEDQADGVHDVRPELPHRVGEYDLRLLVTERDDAVPLRGLRAPDPFDADAVHLVHPVRRAARARIRGEHAHVVPRDRKRLGSARGVELGTSLFLRWVPMRDQEDSQVMGVAAVLAAAPRSGSGRRPTRAPNASRARRMS